MKQSLVRRSLEVVRIHEARFFLDIEGWVSRGGNGLPQLEFLLDVVGDDLFVFWSLKAQELDFVPFSCIR
jgi:hypothetical protein